MLRFTEEDRILWVLPLAYHFAVTIVAYVRAGAHILLCPDTLPGGHRRRRSGVSSASVFYASPLHFERMANLGPTGRSASIRLALSTSAPISPAVMERFESVYGVPVGQAYGIIEAGLPCINRGTDGLPATSVGRAVPGYEVAVFSDDGRRLPSGTPGEIGVRGDGLFSAYYAPWRLREHITRDGWFLTGDIGRLDEAGALYLQGRKKAVIFVAGLKFFPEEVEDVHQPVPRSQGVAGVRPAARAPGSGASGRGGPGSPARPDLDAPESALRARALRLQGSGGVHGRGRGAPNAGRQDPTLSRPHSERRIPCV